MIRNCAQNPKRQEKWERMSRICAQNPKRQEKWERMSRNCAQNPKQSPNEWHIRTALLIPRKIQIKGSLVKIFKFVHKTIYVKKTLFNK